MKPHLVGYVIANDDEEYLHDFYDSRGAVVKTWARLPDFAQVFIIRLEARQMIYKLNQNSTLWVLELWDYDSHFVVTTQDDNRPSWLIPEIAA